ncbi:MAG: hypothetical protein ACTSRQ_14415 [Candidatus Thorarchaeota archaeon]
MEQIERARSLKSFIPHPLETVVLQPFADRCDRMLDEKIDHLMGLLSIVETRADLDVRDLIRSVRGCVRNIKNIESYGIPVLTHQYPRTDYMNKFVFKLHREIKLPLLQPSVACMSTEYYYFHPNLNIIYVPVGESEFLLHLPDLFHEIGHEVLHASGRELKLGEIRKGIDDAALLVTSHFQEVINRKKRETGPRRTIELIRLMHARWMEYWMLEFFCDLFALYTLGPAYAWSHLHLTAKSTEEIHNFPDILDQRHPSDESRMKLLLIGLEKIGFKTESDKIVEKWDDILSDPESNPPNEYRYVYPLNIMEAFAEIVLESLRKCDFNIVNVGLIENNTGIISTLNHAWSSFWDDPSEFRKWEINKLAELRKYIDS